MLNALHDFVTVSVILVIVYAIVSPRVPTGIMPTAGLCMIGFALVWSLDDRHQPDVTLNYITGGLGLVAWGLGWRMWRRRGCKMRRSTDWGDLDELRPEDLHRVSGGKGGA